MDWIVKVGVPSRHFDVLKWTYIPWLLITRRGHIRSIPLRDIGPIPSAKKPGILAHHDLYLDF